MTKNKIPLVSIVIVNWNGINDTTNCLDSVRKLSYKNFEIIVVDNGSEDDSINRLINIKDIKLIKLPVNTGFTGGHIAGIKVANGEYVALLNNDLVVDSNWLSELINVSEGYNADFVGGKSYSWDSKQPAFNINNSYSSFQTVNPITGHTFTLGVGENATLVNSISGSNLLVSKKTIDKIGYLEDYFFAYYEETDMIARGKRIGLKCAYAPKAMVWHKSGESSKNKPYFFFHQMLLNRYFFAYRNLDSKYLHKFKRYYFGEFLRSLRNYSRNHKSLYDKAMVVSYLETRPKLLKLFFERRQILNTGKSYVDRIISKGESEYCVSIAIPCYNYANYIEEALTSAVNQSIKPAQIIVINDGSTDNSKKVIEEFIAKYSDGVSIKFIDQANKGLIATKNIAIEQVKTPWMIFLDADDILDLRYIEKTLILARTTNADVVYTDMQFIGSISGIQSVRKYNKYLLRSVNFVHNSALYNTNTLKAVGGYSDYMKDGFEDWEINLKISKTTSNFKYIKEPLLMYRRHETASRDANAQQKLPMIVKRLENKHPDLYNLKFYIWLETSRAKNEFIGLVKYPFLILRHAKSHLHKKIKASQK